MSFPSEPRGRIIEPERAEHGRGSNVRLWRPRVGVSVCNGASDEGERSDYAIHVRTFPTMLSDSPPRKHPQTVALAVFQGKAHRDDEMTRLPLVFVLPLADVVSIA